MRSISRNGAPQAAPDPWARAGDADATHPCACGSGRAPPATCAHLARNADGDDLLFIHKGAGELYCDFGHLSFAAGDYILIPRGTMWRVECREPLAALAIEATNASYTLPEKGLVGPHAIFDPAMLDMPQLDEAFKAQQSDSAALAGEGEAPRRASRRSRIRSIRSMRWAGTGISRWCAST